MVLEPPRITPEWIAAALERHPGLSFRSRRILELHYGIGGPACNDEEIARTFNISPERIRDVLGRAIADLTAVDARCDTLLSVALICATCHERPAVACDECRRALAMLDRPAGFGSIARHPEQGTNCRLCERGAAELCVECLLTAVLNMRTTEPYAPVDVAEYERQEQRALDATARLQELGDGDALQSMYARTPASSGPSWGRLIGW